MSERVNDLRIWAKWARVVAGADELAKDLDRAADTIAALERDNAAKDALIETSRQQVTALTRVLKQLRGGG